MKYAALSDIHSNVFALEAAVGDAKRRGVEMMLNLGDILYGPIAPGETYELLCEHEFVTIRGNQDRQIYEATDAEIDSNPTLKFVINELGATPINWLKTLPSHQQINEDIYLCHGTPVDDEVYLLENVETGSAQLRSDGEIIKMLNGQSSAIVVCGHTHIPRTVALSSGQLVINPGSVGLPAYTDDEPVAHAMENFCPHASYAIIEKGDVGWTIEHVKVPYDYQMAAKKAAANQREDWARFLTTGRGW